MFRKRGDQNAANDEITVLGEVIETKHTSRIRSASSITRHFKFLKTKFFVFWRWSSSLPGVAISRFTPLPSFSTSVFLLAPPIMIPKVWLWYFSKSRATP